MAQPIRVLLVEDSENDALLVVRELRKGGFDVDWERVFSADSLIHALDRRAWDLIIADYSMPGFKGTEALRLVTARGMDLPFIFVSGTLGEDTAVDAMKSGAHDYLMKGNLRRLVPAIERELREASVRKQSRHMEQRIQYLAYYDELTDLPNRALFRNRLEQTLALARREQRAFALMVLDLDHFKEINDTLGHHAGDLVLKQVATRLRAVLRESDTLARLGGDEFALLLPSLAQEGPDVVARKLLEALEPPVAVEGKRLEVRASLGVVLYPQHGSSPDTLLQRADVAMYLAKEQRSGACVYAPHLDRHSPLRLSMGAELVQAIASDDLQLHYQPLVDLRTGAVLGVEALARWAHPQHGPLAPERFVQIAEQTGSIRQLTDWVLRTGLRQCAAWRAAGLPLRLSANLSARSLEDDLPDQVARILHDAGAAPDWLQFEITETVLMADATRGSEVLSRVHGMGVGIALDDFGTGYSSLTYMSRLPIDVLKIDRSFIVDVERGTDEFIVKAVIDLAHNFGLRVVAEGVETAPVLARLRALGCDAVQGNFIAPAQPPGAFSAWMASWNGLSGPLQEGEQPAPG